MTKHLTSAQQDRTDERREARIRRIGEEVRSGRYQVDAERLCLCILARSTALVAARLARRGAGARASGC